MTGDRQRPASTAAPDLLGCLAPGCDLFAPPAIAAREADWDLGQPLSAVRRDGARAVGDWRASQGGRGHRLAWFGYGPSPGREPVRSGDGSIVPFPTRRAAMDAVEAAWPAPAQEILL